MTKTREVLIPAPDPDNWTLIEKTGISFQVLWEDPDTGATISLLDAPEGSGVPTKHAHASNQFMYCIEGEYEYTESKLTLTKGAFYMNPKGNPHGPTRANKRSLLLEIYDGAHYFKLPDFHSEDTVGRIESEE